MPHAHPWNPALLALPWLLAGCTGAPPVVPPGAPPSPPSVLLVSLDTVRADRLSLYGGPASVPALEALGADAVVFERAFTAFPETAISHWSMMTGVLPEVHGRVPVAGDSEYTGPTLAELLQARGWATGAFIGGSTLWDADCGLARGFTRYDDTRFQGTERPAAEVVAAARAWIQDQPGPWFAFVHLFDAHYPYTPRRREPGDEQAGPEALAPFMAARGAAAPPPLVDHARRLYDREIEEMVEVLGGLLAEVPPETVVVVTADHGESFEHGYLFNHRDVLWEGVLRVPLVIRAPAVPPARSEALVSLVDLAPTILGRVGVSGGEAPFHGVDLLGAAAVRAEAWARTDVDLPDTLLAVRTVDRKVIWRASGAEDAYALGPDPGELQALPVPPDLADARTRYQALLAAANDWRTPRPPRTAPTGEPLQRLEALGYVDPAPPGPGASPAAAPLLHPEAGVPVEDQ